MTVYPASQLARDFEDTWDGVWHRIGEAPSVIAARYSPKFQIHISSLPNPMGAQEFAQFVLGWQKAFPDGRMEILDMIHQEDKLWCYWVSTGTHSDVYLGIPATHRQVAYKGVDIYRYDSGKIAECWAVPDVFALLRQLGAIPG
jgi:steroid delta-isomerase-like uncharacterized protein